MTGDLQKKLEALNTPNPEKPRALPLTLSCYHNKTATHKETKTKIRSLLWVLVFRMFCGPAHPCPAPALPETKRIRKVLASVRFHTSRGRVSPDYGSQERLFNP